MNKVKAQIKVQKSRERIGVGRVKCEKCSVQLTSADCTREDKIADKKKSG